MNRIDRKDARGAGVARIATLAGLLFAAVAALLVVPAKSLAIGVAVLLGGAAAFCVATAWIAAKAPPQRRSFFSPRD